MSFSLTVPKQDALDDFTFALFVAEATPKADGRTKVGRLQRHLVQTAKYALTEMTYELDPPLSATISGHVNKDGTGNVSFTLNLLAPDAD